MSTTTTTRLHTLATLVVTMPVTMLIVLALATSVAPPADASTGYRHDTVKQVRHVVHPALDLANRGAHHRPVRPSRNGGRDASASAISRGEVAISIAASKRGTPYVYGASGPDSFDCSGFTQWVYAHLGVDLPHSAAAQVGYTTRTANPQPGDLVFFPGSGGVYHVAIYAGNHQIWHAPYPGKGVELDAIWTTAVFYGHVR